MNILLLCHSFPFPPTSGDKIRSYNIIQHLAVEHQVTVATLVRTPQQQALAAAETKNVHLIVGHVNDAVQSARMFVRLPTTTPSSFGYFYSAELQASVISLLNRERFDLIVVHCSSVACYVEQVTDTPKILDFADMDSQKWLDYGRHRRFPLSLGYWLEGMKLVREERRQAGRFDTCTVVTPAELESLNALGAHCLTDWFPNGVDCQYFAPGTGTHDRNMIVFVGKMNYFPNEQCMIAFCRDTLPVIRVEVPDARLVIVGSNPSRAVRALARQQGVSVTGAVDDVRPYLHRATVAVAPLELARGTQNKVLEAMAAGVPVVASTLAARGVDAVAGEHLLVAGNPVEFASAVVSILRDDRLRANLAARGRDRMLTHHTWAHAMRRFDEVVSRTLETRLALARGDTRPAAGTAAVTRATRDHADVGAVGPR